MKSDSTGPSQKGWMLNYQNRIITPSIVGQCTISTVIKLQIGDWLDIFSIHFSKTTVLMWGFPFISNNILIYSSDKGTH